MSIRTERVNEEIRKVLSERLVRGLRDPLPGFVTIAAVDVTSDFSHAKVWVSVIGSDEEKEGAVQVLRDNRGALRSEVGRNVRLRQTPELHFLLDEAGERAARVWRLLDEERQRAGVDPSSQAMPQRSSQGSPAATDRNPSAGAPPPPHPAGRGRGPGARGRGPGSGKGPARGGRGAGERGATRGRR